MNDDEDGYGPDDGALEIGHNIGDNLVTRAVLAALVARLAAEREDGPAFIEAIHMDADRSLRRVVSTDPLLARRTMLTLENFIDAAEVGFETLTGLPPGAGHGRAFSGIEE
jgi:hypothetical protein